MALELHAPTPPTAAHKLLIYICPVITSRMLKLAMYVASSPGHTHFSMLHAEKEKAWDATSQLIHHKIMIVGGTVRALSRYDHTSAFYMMPPTYVQPLYRVFFPGKIVALTLVLQVRSKTISMLKTSLRGDVQ